MNYELEIAKRELGGLPLSFGTSFAIESLSGELADLPPHKDRKNLPDELWINIRTLFRNMYSTCNAKIRRGVISVHFIPALEAEIKFINEYVANVTNGKTKVIYYHCTYENISTLFRGAKLKEPNTELQKLYAALENGAVDILDGMFDEEEGLKGLNYRKFKTKVDFGRQYVWIMTSAPVDLLWAKTPKKALLLESHTAKLKEPSLWTTKLTNGKKLERIPFNKLTLQVFGDDGNYFSPMSKAVKDSVLELAEAKNWTQLTKKEKILFDIGSMTDHFGRQILRELMD